MSFLPGSVTATTHCHLQGTTQNTSWNLNNSTLHLLMPWALEATGHQESNFAFPESFIGIHSVLFHGCSNRCFYLRGWHGNYPGEEKRCAFITLEKMITNFKLSKLKRSQVHIIGVVGLSSAVIKCMLLKTNNMFTWFQTSGIIFMQIFMWLPCHTCVKWIIHDLWATWKWRPHIQDVKACAGSQVNAVHQNGHDRKL